MAILQLRWHGFCWRCLLLCAAVFDAGASAAICSQAKDIGKTAVLTIDFKHDDGSDVSAQLLCGEDVAAAAARICTARKTQTSESNTVVQLAKQLQSKLDQAQDLGYTVPDILGKGTSQERLRILDSAGMHSRRAAFHLKKKEYALGVADLVRALMRPDLTPTSTQKLSALLQNHLKKVASDRAEAAKDGDLAELFDALDLEDNGIENSDVDAKTLKKVYRDLSIKYHPDKNEAAAARFNRIRDAYEVLNDPMKTMLYDTGGIELVRKYEGGGSDLETTGGEERTMTVSLEDVYMGTTRKLVHSRRIVCRSCRLHPELPRCKSCRRCPGEKEIRQRWINSYQYMEEEHEVPSKEKCTSFTEELDINIERGMSVGERINFPHKADQTPKKIAGDFQVSLQIRDHQLFKRIGNDLVIVVKVSLFEALLGFQRELVHLDGHKVSFGMEKGTVLKPGKGLQIEGEGMPLKEDPTSFGKLVVQFQIEFPEAIPLSTMDALETALRGTGQGPQPSQVTRSIQQKKRRSEL